MGNKIVRDLLEKISAACEPCQEFKSRPLLFKAILPPERLVFNNAISIDIVWINDYPVLHVIDDHTGFRNAVFLRSKSAEDIWSPFMACWASTYVGLPNVTRSDQESVVSSKKFWELSTADRIQLKFTGVSAHNSTGRLEQAHGTIRRIFRILIAEHPALT